MTNAAASIAELHQRAAAGDAEAQLALAYGALTQKPGAPSLEEGARLLESACTQELAAALLLKSVLVMRGVGRPRSIDSAYALLQQAASCGSAEARSQLSVLGADGLDKAPWRKAIELTPLADAPRIYCVEEFLPGRICDWLMAAARSRLGPAVINVPGGSAAPHPSRTNSAATFSQLEADLVMQLVGRRMARATGAELSHHEPFNVLHYAPGQEYRPHYDILTPWGRDRNVFVSERATLGLRMATVLVYLNDGYEGGETVFPFLGLTYRGKRGDALIFWSVSEAGEPERDSLHAGKPVLRGEKWLLSQWIREKPFPLQ